WIYDELLFDHYFQNHDRIVQVMQHQFVNDETQTYAQVPAPLGEELRNSYGSAFQYVVTSTRIEKHVLLYGDKKFTQNGSFIEPAITHMLTLRMIQGSLDGLKKPSSILLAESVAKALFRDKEDVEKCLQFGAEFVKHLS
ncbi:MAG: hypothetical protein QM671_26200, partial [Bacillus sp. (in: firmicutes)]